MTSDDRSTTLTMEEHAMMMSAQQTHLLSVVEAARRQLVAHGIAISNLAEKTIHQPWEVSCIVAALLKTIQQKDLVLKEGKGTKDASTTGDAYDVKSKRRNRQRDHTYVALGSQPRLPHER